MDKREREHMMENAIRKAYENCGFFPIGKLNCLDDIPTAAGGKLCLGMECLDRDLWDFDRAFETIRALGVRRVRLQTGWQKTEQTPGAYDFQWLDHIVDQLKSAGIQPFLSLSYGNRLYCSNPQDCPNLDNGGVGHIPVVTPEEREAWQCYVRHIVQHFRDRVHEYEVWNEPDVAVFCRVPMSWPDAYMELVKLTVPVIREEMPEATVITCTAGLENIAMLLRRGMGSYTDVHSFHGYQFFPEMRPAAYCRSQLNRCLQQAPHLRFWRGEAGCPSYNDPISKGALSNIPVTEIKQAKFLLRHLLQDLANDALEMSSYFHAYDFEHFTHKLRYHYGVIRHEDLSRKPAYHCLQVLAHLFDGSTVHTEPAPAFIQDGSDLSPQELLTLQLFAFSRNGQPVYSCHLPLEIVDDFAVHSVRLCLPQKLEHPVILDPMTGSVYAPQDDTFPVTDYPLFIMDASALAPFAQVNLQSKNTVCTEDLTQKIEE